MITTAFGTAMLGAASLVCGCAAMSESECLSADWYAVGERDGRDGRPAAQLDRYHDACAKFGVYPTSTDSRWDKTVFSL